MKTRVGKKILSMCMVAHRSHSKTAVISEVLLQNQSEFSTKLEKK